MVSGPGPLGHPLSAFPPMMIPNRGGFRGRGGYRGRVHGGGRGGFRGAHGGSGGGQQQHNNTQRYPPAQSFCVSAVQPQAATPAPGDPGRYEALVEVCERQQEQIHLLSEQLTRFSSTTTN